MSATNHPVLTEEKLLHILRTIHKDSSRVKMRSFSVRDGSKPGQSLASEILECEAECELEGEVKWHRWVAKVQPKETLFMEGMRAEEKEIAFYQ